MADMPLQITAKTAKRGRPFEKGRSGNPAGRPRGSTNQATKSAAALLDGEAAALTRKAVELALGGDAAALRLCLERIMGPRRGRPVELALPPIKSAADIAGTMGALTAAAARGEITPAEAAEMAKVVDILVHSIDTSDFDRRLKTLEAQDGAKAVAHPFYGYPRGQS